MPMRAGYLAPRILENHQLRPDHLRELSGSGIDFVTAAFAGVSSIDHGSAYDLGLRGGGSLDGLCYRYWDPMRRRFSERFVRVKTNVPIDGRKYRQPVGEVPRLYFPAGTRLEDLSNTQILAFLPEGEKKTLALDVAAKTVGIRALVVGVGGVWAWRYSPKELQPNGSLGKGKSRPIEDLNLIEWRGRKTYLLFDSDVQTNWKVATAETALARELTGRGAQVYQVRFSEVTT